MSETGPTPGWYPDAERAGGERWWDGSAWTEHRRAAGPPQPSGDAGYPPPPGAPGPGAPAPGVPRSPYGQPVPQGYVPYASAPTVWNTKSNAGVALALSIAGFLCCGLLAIPGLIMGRNEMKAIDAGQANPAKRGLANAAFIVGIIVLSLNAVVILLFAVGAGFGR